MWSTTTPPGCRNWPISRPSGPTVTARREARVSRKAKGKPGVRITATRRLQRRYTRPRPLKRVMGSFTAVHAARLSSVTAHVLGQEVPRVAALALRARAWRERERRPYKAGSLIGLLNGGLRRRRHLVVLRSELLFDRFPQRFLKK